MTAPTIHLVFKTHLDIGFTDHAAHVRRQYHEQFIPQAIATGEHFYREDPERPAFIWTTGAWLIWDHLNSQEQAKARRLEQAIERGLIAWHGLPFTTHTELMSSAVFRAGLSYAAELDRRFGRKTIAAKMTDVPGHTLGMVPLMAEAGLKFLHLGVNTASPVPDVPPIFRWRAPGGEEVVVMYQASYGETDFPAGPDIGLSFAHTNDNVGPQSVGQAVEAMRHMRQSFPAASVRASTLDAFGAEMWARREHFPVVDIEIGDSWIHGIGSDPIKLARYKALSHLYDGWSDAMTPQRLALGRGLAMVAEHTWGVDIKTYLRDEMAWDKPDFEAARRDDYRFAFTEDSWREQRHYMDAAVAELEEEDRAAAATADGATVPPIALDAVAGEAALSHGGWTAELDATTGDIAALVSPQGIRISGRDGSLVGYRHESYDWPELQKHLETYLQHRAEWAILDHDKPGLALAKTARNARFTPGFLGVAGGNVSVGHLPDAAAPVGGPGRHDLAIRGINDKQVEITLALRDKPANRMPEAGFLLLTPDGGSEWALKKMGLWHDGRKIVTGGGGQLQAVSALRCTAGGGGLHMALLDSALVGPAGAPFIPFRPGVPDWSGGAAVNLYNNKWGTNFPMWWEGTMMSRIILTLE